MQLMLISIKSCNASIFNATVPHMNSYIGNAALEISVSILSMVGSQCASTPLTVHCTTHPLTDLHTPSHACTIFDVQQHHCSNTGPHLHQDRAAVQHACRCASTGVCEGVGGAAGELNPDPCFYLLFTPSVFGANGLQTARRISGSWRSHR